MHASISTTEVLLLAIALVFFLPYLIWRVGKTDYYAPLVVIQIVTGILLGPGVLGAAYPNYYAFLFNAQVVQSLNGIATWAVMIFVMIAGIELDLHEAWRFRRESLITAGFALGTPLACGCLLGVALLAFPGWVGNGGQPWQFTLGIGMACAVTALPILILLLEKLDVLRAPIGQRILRYASLDDLAIWAVLGVILLDWGQVGHQISFVVAFAITAVLFRKLMAALKEMDRWYASLIWLALCGFAADWVGLHFMVGAFLAGVAMEASWFDQKKLDALRQHLLFALMPIYFLSTGLKTNWDTGGGTAVLLVAAALLVVSILGKLAGVQLAGRLLRWSRDEALVIGWLLQTKALIMIIFANMLLDKGIITSASFTALLLMAIGSTMLTVPMVHAKLARLQAASTVSPDISRHGLQG